MLTPIELRHALHQNPELMFHEFETTNILKRNLQEFNNIVIHQPLETGLVVEYTVNNGDYILFRADIDALPIREDSGAAFSSKNNYMHACGHDVHSSILYGFIKHVTESRPKRNMIFLFQPGEEGGGGAKKIIDSGILSRFNISRAFALHVTDEYSLGTIASTAGVLFASAYELDIIIHGKSAHVAFPENGINSFDALRMFLDEIQKELNSSDEKIIFGYGRVESGTVRNIIPSYTKAECTIRALDSRKNEQFFKKIVSKLEELKDKTGVTWSIDHGSLYSEVIVDKELFSLMSEKLSKKHEFIDCGYKMTGEDFGFISHLYPSFMFWLGTYTNKKYGLHTPKFLPEDSAIQSGIEILKDILQEV
ncbi:MAG: amidohydrolase [Syntrophomonadaceae bacterium]